MFSHFKNFLFVEILLICATGRFGEGLESFISNILSNIIDAEHADGPCDGALNNAPETVYWVYTTDNPINPRVVSEPSTTMCGGRTRIILLGHGWTGDASSFYIINLKDAYLKRYPDACIISINWGFYAKKNYFSAYCIAPGIASNIANFVCKLQVHSKTLHFVGHSMGAHIFGIAGNLVQRKCDAIIGRITALDPAGPLYQDISTDKRVDKSDALFVDVIHTNQGQLGYTGPCGHIDTYVECGYFQPGCRTSAKSPLRNATDLLGLPLYLGICSHALSLTYFEESINSNRFIGTNCLGCPAPACGNESFPVKIEKKVIGEDCTSPGEFQNYKLEVNSEPPYAKG